MTSNAWEGRSRLGFGGDARPARPRVMQIAHALGSALGYKIRRSLGATPRSLEEAASRVWTVSPGAVEPAFRPFIPESHLERIHASVLGETREQILADLVVPRLEHRPTRAFLLRDAVLVDRSLYCGNHKEDLFRGVGLRKALWSAPVEELDEACWVTSYAGSRWLGHFLRDELSLEELARPLGPLIGHERPVYLHEPGWRHEFRAPRPSTFGIVRVRQLTCFDDVGQHPDKRRRYDRLRARLGERPHGHDRVLFLRGHANAEERRVINEDEVIERLVREGFHVIDPIRLAVPEILERCWRASVFVTIEGSHASPILYMGRKGATVVYLLPPTRVATHSPRLASYFGLNGAMFVGEPVEGSPGAFRVDPEELVRTLDRALRSGNAD